MQELITFAAFMLAYLSSVLIVVLGVTWLVHRTVMQPRKPKPRPRRPTLLQALSPRNLHRLLDMERQIPVIGRWSPIWHEHRRQLLAHAETRGADGQEPNPNVRDAVVRFIQEVELQLVRDGYDTFSCAPNEISVWISDDLLKRIWIYLETARGSGIAPTTNWCSIRAALCDCAHRGGSDAQQAQARELIYELEDELAASGFEVATRFKE